MDTLYPIFYGTRLVTLDVLKATFQPHMHPEAFRRAFAFIEQQGGLFGIGGGYRAPGTQPADKPGFAPAGKSFHEGQKFPSGVYYVALDTVCVNPGHVHRTPTWDEVPKQGSAFAGRFGWHMNVSAESWHSQPEELDGYDTWVAHGRPDLVFNRPINGAIAPLPPIPQPPVPDTQPPTQGVIVQVNSRNLAEGAVGNDVKFFQRQMNDIAGQGLLLDGHYGPSTTQAVKNWQTVFHLTVDGNLGPKTQESIIEISLTV